jgi:hypothetical protein
MSYIVLTINVDKLAKAPDSDSIVRLMWALNDMNQSTHLGKLVKGEYITHPELWKYRDSIMASLTRQRSARVTEILENIVQRLIADDAKTNYPELHGLIEADEELRSLKASLRDLICGDQKEEFKRHRQIRHRITDHFDHKSNYLIVPEAIQLTVHQMKADAGGIKRGWIFYGSREKNQEVSRYFFADEVLETAWREGILKIPFQKSYADSKMLKEARKFTSYFMELFHKFATKLIDIYCKKYALWLEQCNPNDLLYCIESIQHLPLEILAGENHAAAEVSDFFGSTKLLTDNAAALYESITKLIVESSNFGSVFDLNQRTAIFDCLQSLRYSLVMSMTTMLRGHVTDSTNHSRRSVEIAAFLLEICSNTENAKRWLDMGKSKSARKKYKSAFQAHQLVAKHKDILTEKIVDLYDNFCLFVHPSYASMYHQIKIVGNQHQFHYFEHQTDVQKANMVIQFFILLNTHMRLMDALSKFFESKNLSFVMTKWKEHYEMLVEETEKAKQQWMPLAKEFGLEQD